jgi:hypothetical protein
MPCAIGTTIVQDAVNRWKNELRRLPGIPKTWGPETGKRVHPNTTRVLAFIGSLEDTDVSEPWWVMGETPPLRVSKSLTSEPLELSTIRASARLATRGIVGDTRPSTVPVERTIGKIVRVNPDMVATPKDRRFVRSEGTQKKKGASLLKESELPRNVARLLPSVEVVGFSGSSTMEIPQSAYMIPGE